MFSLANAALPQWASCFYFATLSLCCPYIIVNIIVSYIHTMDAKSVSCFKVHVLE